MDRRRGYADSARESTKGRSVPEDDRGGAVQQHAVLQVIADGAGEDAALDVAAFKQRYGMTRKYAIPLLEYLDRERVTRRAGEKRVVI